MRTRDVIHTFNKQADQITADKERHQKQHQVLVCTGGGCIASGSLEIEKAFKSAIEHYHLDIPVIGTGCMGPCSKGPVVKIMPEKIVYQHVTVNQVEKITTEHLKGGTPVEELLMTDDHPVKILHNETEAAFLSPQQKIVLRNCGVVDPLDITDYIGRRGYRGLAKVLSEDSSDAVIDQLKTAGLKGRGGAGFPTWLKWKFASESAGKEKFVLCNADEGDPGAFMDRSVLEGDPHSVIEGMAIAALTIGAQQGYVYVRAEYPLAVARLQRAIEDARSYGLLGENILGSGFSFDLEIRMGSGAFVCGEETALINSIEGKRGEPRPRPPFPAQQGLWGSPTLLNNVETYANIPPIIDQGAQWYSGFGSEHSKGTKVFALAGAVRTTGLVEIPIGTPLGDLIFTVGGGIKLGRPFKAAQIGGPSGGCIPKQHLGVPLDYESLKELGAIIGSGGLIVLDDTSCMVDVARYFLEFIQEESCGKCVPCRVGTKRMLEILTRICNGEGVQGDIEKLEELGSQIRQTALCGLGQTAPNPVLSTIRHFRDEYEAHIRDKHCEAGVCPGLVRAPCQSACPARVDVPGFVALSAEGRYAEALKLHRERNPLASICARVCFHTCEDKCRRTSIDQPVAIRNIKRFMVDQEVTFQVPEVRESEVNARRNITIVGAGPAGLSCAYFLARLGYRPTILEASVRPGGMLIQTIPAYRLPRETVAQEIRMIERMGVDIITEQRMGRDYTLESLLNDAHTDAVFLGLGAPDSLSMGLPGEDAEGVIQSVPFLQRYNVRGSAEVGKRVIVIGGGNAAIDAARTALRLGAEAVEIVYRRSQEEMPAYAEEVAEALQEGVTISSLTQPVEIKKDSSGHVNGLKCLRMSLGEFDASGRRRPKALSDEPITLKADQVIMAIGQRLDLRELLGETDIQLNSKGFIASSPVDGATSIRSVFAGGDCSDGPASVVEAIAAGERAAVGIDQMLTGENHAFWRYEKIIETAFDPDAEPSNEPRAEINQVPIERRRANFEEVERPWCESVTKAQAIRCLRCDYGKHIREEDKEETHA
ncbi:MAG: NADH-ubiquinone oxidoreductase-F iron-sulfur binding region domain-containing protein [Spirochaetota bacterium]